MQSPGHDAVACCHSITDDMAGDCAGAFVALPLVLSTLLMIVCIQLVTERKRPCQLLWPFAL